MQISSPGIRFKTIPGILQAVDRTNATIYKRNAVKGIQDFHIPANGLYTMLVGTERYEVLIKFFSCVLDVNK